MVWYSLAASYARIQGIFPSSPRDVRRETHLLIALLGIGQQLQKHSVLAKAVVMQRETPRGWGHVPSAWSRS